MIAESVEMRSEHLISLPRMLAGRYRPATTREIRSWSFGQVKKRRKRGASDWREQVGTLDDQRIFGPLQEFACACGKYKGERFRGMICDVCGVKITSLAARRERFGHLEFSRTIQHPLGGATDQIDAFPVLPAALLDSPSGARLAECYDTLAEQSAAAFDQQVLVRLVEILLPAVQVTHE